MQTPPGYVYALSGPRILMHFPNLKLGENSTITSLKGDDYNCAAWAIEVIDEWVQFLDSDGNYDLGIETYANYYKGKGFLDAENALLEQGYFKIAIYCDDKMEFTHVARQLPNGSWTSKLGAWEDIEHSTPEVVSGKSYGKPCRFLKKAI